MIWFPQLEPFWLQEVLQPVDRQREKCERGNGNLQSKCRKGCWLLRTSIVGEFKIAMTFPFFEYLSLVASFELWPRLLFPLILPMVPWHIGSIGVVLKTVSSVSEICSQSKSDFDGGTKGIGLRKKKIWIFCWKDCVFCSFLFSGLLATLVILHWCCSKLKHSFNFI